MQSIFFPSVRIEDRFDIKGCTAGRYQKVGQGLSIYFMAGVSDSLDFYTSEFVFTPCVITVEEDECAISSLHKVRLTKSGAVENRELI